MKKRLLILSDSPTLNSGLARCVKEITSRLSDKYEIRVAGWHQSSRAHNFSFHIYPIYKGMREEYAQVELAMNDFKPNIFLAIGDLWDFFEVSKLIYNWRAENKNFSSIAWLTVDSDNLHSAWLPVIQSFDCVTVFSKYAQKIIKNFSNIDANVIYPGVDTGVFKKLGQEFTYSKTQLNPSKTFISLVVSQNTDRKAIPLAMEAYARFAKDKNDVFLIIASDPHDPHGYDLWEIINNLKITNKIAVSRDCNPRYGMPDEKLNILYNLATVLISSSIGEGFCLPLLEAMATGVIPIATNYTSPPELLTDNRGLLVDVVAFIYGAYGLRRAVISVDNMVNHLNTLYDSWKGDRKLIGEMSTKCYEYAKIFTWEKTIFELDKLLTSSHEEKIRPWIRENVYIKDVRLLMIIPSWGKHCGIAEYTKDLCASFDEINKSTVIYPTGDLSDLVNYCKKQKINVVHIQHEFSFFKNKNQIETALQNLNHAGIKTIITMHSFCPGLKSYNQMLIDTCDKILFHSQRFVNEICQNYQHRNNVQFIAMGCKLHYPYEKGTVQLAKQNLGIEKRKPIIGSFGFLRDQKGFKELILAVKSMRNEFPDICLLLISPKHEFGSMVYDEEFFRFIEREKMDDTCIIIREYLPETKLLKILQTVDFFILNYQDSPAGSGISAAVKTLMRSQRPIIVSDTMSFWDLNKGEVLKGENLNVESMINLSKKIMYDKDLCDLLVKNANAFLENNKWYNIANMHWDLYMD